MPKITKAISEAIDKTKLFFLASVNEDNSPSLSPKASLDVWDENSVIFAHITSFNTIHNLKTRPKVVLNIVDFIKRKGYRLTGHAALFYEGTPEYLFVSNKLWNAHGRQFPVHCAVKVHVEDIDEIKSPAYKYAENPSEETISAHFSNYYKHQL